MRKKPTSNQVNDYLNLLHQNTGHLGIMKALRRKGYSDFEIGKYLDRQGFTYEEKIDLIRELNKS